MTQVPVFHARPGTSAAFHGLSLNCPVVPTSRTLMPSTKNGSSSNLTAVFRSTIRWTAVTPPVPVPRVDRRYRDRRLVLLGEEGIAGGPLRAGDHIDVGSGDGRRREGRRDGQEDAGDERSKASPCIVMRIHPRPLFFLMCSQNAPS